MLEILEQFVSVLSNDPVLTAIVPASNILVGPVDILTETQAGLKLPQINIHVVSEAQRSVPLSTRDSLIQIDIWDRNSQLEVVTIYERIIALLSYQTYDKSVAHVFWQRLGGATDLYESDRRIFHRAMTYTAWSIKSEVVNTLSVSDQTPVVDSPTVVEH